MAISGEFENVERVQAELFVKINGELRPATHNDLEKFGFVPADQAPPAPAPEPEPEVAPKPETPNADNFADIPPEQAEKLQNLFARLSQKAQEEEPKKPTAEEARRDVPESDGPDFGRLFDALGGGDGEMPFEFIFGLFPGSQDFDFNSLKDIFDQFGDASNPGNKNEDKSSDKTPPSNPFDGMGNGGFSGNGLNGIPPEVMIQLLMKFLGNGGLGGNR